MTTASENSEPETSSPIGQLVRGWSPVIELRQYTLHPGQRDRLIELFDPMFVESQEEVGMKVIGQFRDLDDPDKFVWLRGFSDMDGRRDSLTAFYDGPVWAANRDAANATMVDSDDVLLLRPARPNSAFVLDEDRRPAVGTTSPRPGFVQAALLQLESANDEARAVAFFETEVAPRLGGTHVSTLAYFVTEPSENTFPRLPVRVGEHVFVWFGGVPDRAAFDSLRGDERSFDAVMAEMPGLTRSPQTLRLVPTSRSLLHGAWSPCLAAREIGPSSPS